MSITKEEMSKIKNKHTAECAECNWIGTKYKVIITATEYLCPKCNSNMIVIFKEAKQNT